MESDNEFHIEFSFEKERKLWNNLFSNGLIHISTNCPKCQHNISIIQNNTLNNPYIAQCSSSKCRKKLGLFKFSRPLYYFVMFFYDSIIRKIIHK